MPKVKMKVSMAGSEFSYVPGDIIDVRDDVAEAWINNNIAEIFVPPEENVILHKEDIPLEEKNETGSADEEKSNEEVKTNSKESPKKKVKKDANAE